MADKKILVDFDYDNIVIIDPNKTVGTNGNSYDERLVQHEELVMYANLEARVIPGTKLVQGSTLDDSIRNVKIAQINFLNPGGKGYFSNEYTDFLQPISISIYIPPYLYSTKKRNASHL